MGAGEGVGPAAGAEGGVMVCGVSCPPPPQATIAQAAIRLSTWARRRGRDGTSCGASWNSSIQEKQLDAVSGTFWHTESVDMDKEMALRVRFHGWPSMSQLPVRADIL